MKKILISIGLLLVGFLWLGATSGPAAAQQYTDAWISVGHGDAIYLVTADSYGCAWGSNSRATINVAGMCGRDPNTSNRFMVYAHNLNCTQVWCGWMRQSGNAVGGSWNWPALSPGDPVTLHYAGRDWRGTVMQVILFADRAGITGNDDFPCPTAVCGTLTTSAGVPHVDYAVIRVEYR